MLRMLLVLKNSDADVDLAAASEFLKDNSLKQAVYPISDQPAACTVYLVTDWVLQELSCRKEQRRKMWFWKWSIHDDGDAGESESGDGDDYGDGDGKNGDQTNGI